MALASLYRCSVDYILGLKHNNSIDIDTSMLSDKQTKLLQNYLSGFPPCNLPFQILY